MPPFDPLLPDLGSFLVVHRDVVAASTTRHRLPTISPVRVFAASGGLMSYGVIVDSMYQGAAIYCTLTTSGGRARPPCSSWCGERRSCRGRALGHDRHGPRRSAASRRRSGGARPSADGAALPRYQV